MATMERVVSGPPAYIVSFADSSRLPSLQGSTRHFISKDAYDDWIKRHDAYKPDLSRGKDEKKHVISPSPLLSTILENIPPRQTTSRSNIIDYLSYQCCEARLEAAAIMEAELRWMEEEASMKAEQVEGMEETRKRDSFPLSDLRKAEMDSRKAEGLSTLVATMMDKSKASTRAIKMVDSRPSDAHVFPGFKTLPSLAHKDSGSQTMPILQKRLPKSTIRRVALHNLLDNILGFGSQSTPTKYFLLFPSTSGRDPAPALRVLGLVSSKTYQSSMTSINLGGKQAENSVTKILIEKKFKSSKSSVIISEAEGSLTAGHPLFGAERTPHMDYRIVQTQNARSRARVVFGPGVKGAWCGLHRLDNCDSCFTVDRLGMGKMVSVNDRRGMSLPAQGITPSESMGRKAALVESIADFIIFSADLLMESRKTQLVDNGRKNAEDEMLWENWENEILKSAHAGTSVGKSPISSTFEASGNTSSSGMSEKGKEKEVLPPLPIELHLRWYNLLADFLIAACLEGYLVHGWKGVDPVECLFGVGCGGWEGRGWANKLPSLTDLNKSTTTPDMTESEYGYSHSHDDGEDGEDEDDSGEESAKVMEKREKAEKTLLFMTKLHNAARLLFGKMNQNQSEFERMMRDRTHEFLNIPEEDTLESHLRHLSAKYPLSRFISEARVFFLAARSFLGVPQLAQVGQATTDLSTASSIVPLSNFMDRLDPDQEIVTNEVWEHEKLKRNKRPRQMSITEDSMSSGSNKRKMEEPKKTMEEGMGLR